MPSHDRTLISYILFFIFLWVVGYLLFVKLPAVTLILIISYMIEEMLYPAVMLFARRKIPLIISAFMVVLLFFSVLTILFILVIPEIANQILIIQHELPSLFSETLKFINFIYGKFSNLFGNIPQGKELLDSSVIQLRNWASGMALSSFTKILSGVEEIISMVLIPFFVFLIMLYKDRYKTSFKEFVSSIFGEKYYKVFQDINDMVLEYLKGLLIVIIIIGATISIGLYFLNVKFALLIGVFSGISFVIPYIGSIASTAVAVAVSYIQYHSVGVPIEVLIFYLVVHLIGGNMLIPFFFSKQLRIDPLTTLVAILVSGGLFGIWGIIIAIPLLGIVLILYRNLLVLLQ